MFNVKNINLAVCCFITLFGFSLSASAQMSTFDYGPVISNFGQHAPVPGHSLSKESEFKVAFDVASTSGAVTLNRKFESLARFINMHAAAGVKKENIRLVLVVHGKATLDLLNEASYRAKYNASNPNESLIKALQENNVQVIVCGQSAAANAVKSSQLIEGVEMQLSAMTAHALLQQKGYTVNPF